MWRDDIVEKSWQVLADLRSLADFILIGGWAVYLWTNKLKSRDIDICIDQENFYRLQSQLLQRNYALKRNIRLMKFEAVIGDVEIDIYTPFMSKLVVPCQDMFKKKMHSTVQRFQVATPETLLLLKTQAAQQRWQAEKGVKDRVDIISLLKFADIKHDTLKQMLKKYDSTGTLRNTVKRTISESRIEYKFLGLTYEKDGVHLKKIFTNL